MSSVQAEIEEHKAANLSAVGHFDAFREHREHLTALAVARARPDGEGRLCVLGAGNCYDLDLVTLADVYREIHLVDIDSSAIERASERHEPAVQARLFRHAPLDLSGALDKLERWRRYEVSPQELISHAEVTAQMLKNALPGPFDTVLSACVLTPLQLSLLNVIGDSHRLFQALRQVFTLTHLRTLHALVAPGGRAILATDVTSEALYPLRALAPTADLEQVLNDALSAQQAFFVANPELLHATIQDDPILQRDALSIPVDVWLWHNGPERIFLVYALELARS